MNTDATGRERRRVRPKYSADIETPWEYGLHARPQHESQTTFRGMDEDQMRQPHNPHSGFCAINPRNDETPELPMLFGLSNPAGEKRTHNPTAQTGIDILACLANNDK